LAAANRGEFPPEPKQTVLSPTAQSEGVTWRYTTDKPADDWFKPEFNSAARWNQGKSGFGTQGTPGAIIGTEWKSADIWLRRGFTAPAGEFHDLALLMAHDEDAEIYINGVSASKVKGHIGSYEEFSLSPEAIQALKPGKNDIAVHCHQTTGGQYIDVGLINYESPAPK